MERQNLNLKMGVRCFTRLTNAFSKRLQNHVHPLTILWPVMSRHCQLNESGTYEGRLIRDQAAVTAVHTVNARARNIR